MQRSRVEEMRLFRPMANVSSLASSLVWTQSKFSIFLTSGESTWVRAIYCRAKQPDSVWKQTINQVSWSTFQITEGYKYLTDIQIKENRTKMAINTQGACLREHRVFTHTRTWLVGVWFSVSFTVYCFSHDLQECFSLYLCIQNTLFL